MVVSQTDIIDHLNRLLETNINGSAACIIRHLLQEPHKINLKLLTGERRDQQGKWDKMTKRIMNKWKSLQQGWFVRFLDGNTLNNHVNNMKWVNMEDTLVRHWDDRTWTVDWDSELSESECQLVMNPKWREGLIFRPRAA